MVWIQEVVHVNRMRASHSQGLIVLALSIVFCPDALVCPCLASSPQNPTRAIFNAPLDQTVQAVTNAFSLRTYHGMSFLPAVQEWDIEKRRWNNSRATNAWSLYGTTLGGSTLFTTWRGKSVPYMAEFLIYAVPAGDKNTQITVITTSSCIPGGKELGVHGGWLLGVKHVPPVREEETNLLARIARQLAAIQTANANPLPPTPDEVIRRTEDRPTSNRGLLEEVLARQDLSDAERNELLSYKKLRLSIQGNGANGTPDIGVDPGRSGLNRSMRELHPEWEINLKKELSNSNLSDFDRKVLLLRLKELTNSAR